MTIIDPSAPLINETPKTTVVLGVALLHLVSGEDVIGRVEYDAENKVYSIERPVVPMLRPKLNDAGQEVGASLGFAPYRFFLDPNEALLIRDASVIFCGKLLDAVANQYVQVTSDIVVAPAGSVKDIRG